MLCTDLCQVAEGSEIANTPAAAGAYRVQLCHDTMRRILHVLVGSGETVGGYGHIALSDVVIVDCAQAMPTKWQILWNCEGGFTHQHIADLAWRYQVVHLSAGPFCAVLQFHSHADIAAVRYVNQNSVEDALAGNYHGREKARPLRVRPLTTGIVDFGITGIWAQIDVESSESF